VLGTTLRFPVEGQHPIGSDLQDRISGLDGLSAFAAVHNGTVGALVRYEHDDIREAFGLQWLSLNNLWLEAGFYSEAVTGAWERTTRTSFYLQAEGAASMHCPVLGDASTLTAGARLHVGYDSRTALTWSVAPVGWPALEAFGRLGLCLISEAVGVDPELIRALNGVRAEEDSGRVFAPYERLEWVVGTLEHRLSEALEHPVVAPLRLREGVTGIYLQVYGLTSTNLLHSALNGLDKFKTLEWLAEMFPIDAALTVPHHGSGAVSLYTRIRIPRIVIVEPSSRHDGVAIRGVTLESEVTNAGRWRTRLASTLDLFDLSLDFTAAWTSEHGPVITVRLYHVTLFTLNFFGQRRLDLYDAVLLLDIGRNKYLLTGTLVWTGPSGGTSEHDFTFDIGKAIAYISKIVSLAAMAGRRLEQADTGLLQPRILQRNDTGEEVMEVPLKIEHIEQTPPNTTDAGECVDAQVVPAPLVVHGNYYEAADETSSLALVGFSVASFLGGLLLGACAMGATVYCTWRRVGGTLHRSASIGIPQVVPVRCSLPPSGKASGRRPSPDTAQPPLGATWSSDI